MKWYLSRLLKHYKPDKFSNQQENNINYKNTNYTKNNNEENDKYSPVYTSDKKIRYVEEDNSNVPTYSPSKQLLNRLSNPSTPNKKYNNIIPNEELSKYGIIDDYINEIKNENLDEYGVYQDEKQNEDYVYNNNQDRNQDENKSESEKENDNADNYDDEPSTANESSTTNSTDIIMAEIMSRKPKDMVSKIPKPTKAKTHLAPENLYYRSVNRPKTTKKENKSYKFKPNKIPYSSLDHRFESITEAQEMMRKDRITKRKKELEESIKPFYGLEERETINKLNKSISLKYRQDEIKKQHKQFRANSIEKLCQKHTNDEIIKEKEEKKQNEKIKTNEKSQKLIKQSHLPLRMDMDKLSKEYKLLEEKKLQEEKNMKQKKSLDDYLQPQFTKPKPFSFDNPESKRYQQLQLLKKRISERAYQDKMNEIEREREEEVNNEQYIKLLVNKQYPFPKSTIAIKYLSDKRRKEREDEEKKKKEEEEEEQLRKKKEKELSKSKKEYLKKLKEDLSEELITERAEIRQKEIKTRIKSKNPSSMEIDSVEELPVKYVEPELRYKREMLKKKKEEESIQEEVEKYMQQLKKKRKQYKRNNGIYSYPPNYHNVNNDENENDNDNEEVDESIEKPKENQEIKKEKENETKSDNDDEFDEGFEDNIKVEKEEINKPISTETPSIENTTTTTTKNLVEEKPKEKPVEEKPEEKPINKSETNTTNKDKDEEEDLFDEDF